MKGKIARLKSFFILMVMLVVCLCFSIFMWARHSFGVRRTFVYNSLSSFSLVVETRYLPSNPVEGRIRNYIDELILGSISERCQRIFPKGTAVLSCFESEHNLYVDFSGDVITRADPTNYNFEEAFSLFCKNIRRNFPGLHAIFIFVDGVEVYEG